ncbi:MAG TPA: DUF2934 domain-containing protein [Burkholderiales bacterium]|nr:DUF2934 domain-containing protein [Burkholderiales bacterium]
MEKTDVTKPKRKTAAKTETAAKSATAAKSTAAAEAPKRTVSRAKKDPQISPELRHRMIADAAYYRAKKFGSSGTGEDLVHWLAAEAEIDAMLRKGGVSS